MISSLLESKIENFSDISTEECSYILKNNLLEAFECEALLENELIKRFINLLYSERDPLRQELNTAIRSNNQDLEQFSVKQWISKYRKTYNNIERNPDTFFHFVSSDTEAQKLTEIDKKKLMRILRMYDYLLSIPIPGMTDTIMQIMRFPLRIQADNSVTKKSFSLPTNEPAQIVKLSFNEALKQFPEIGEQIITSNRIKIMSFPEPARPSIKNWIADYTSILGRENHDSIARGNYLFHNTNTQTLNSNDRQRLAYVLKAFDEKTEVTVNTAMKQIIFPVNSTPSNVQQSTQITNSIRRGGQIPNTLPAGRQESQIQNPNIQKVAFQNPNIQRASANFESSKAQPLEFAQASSRLSLEKKPQTTNYQLPTNKISFSSPQKLSYEKTPIISKPVVQNKPVEMKPFRPQFNQITPTPPIRENAPLKTTAPSIPPAKNTNSAPARPTGWAWNTVQSAETNAQPYRITPTSNRQPDNARPVAKNIVDLKNNF